jgi:hypothetical protein
MSLSLYPPVCFPLVGNSSPAPPTPLSRHYDSVYPMSCFKEMWQPSLWASEFLGPLLLCDVWKLEVQRLVQCHLPRCGQSQTPNSIPVLPLSFIILKSPVLLPLTHRHGAL